jgi:hypothetical protein
MTQVYRSKLAWRNYFGQNLRPLSLDASSLGYEHESLQEPLVRSRQLSLSSAYHCSSRIASRAFLDAQRFSRFVLFFSLSLGLIRMPALMPCGLLVRELSFRSVTGRLRIWAVVRARSLMRYDDAHDSHHG